MVYDLFVGAYCNTPLQGRFGIIMPDVFKILGSHRSIRKYKEEPIADDLLDKILTSARQAPTSANLQAYSIIVVKDKEKKKTLAHLCGDQPWVESCPVFLAICPDLHRLDKVCRKRDYQFNDHYIEIFMVAVVDAALVAQNIVVGAEASGLGICMIGGIRNNPDQVCELLKLPERVFPLMGMCLGWPDHDPILKPRLPLEVVIHHEEYDDAELLRFLDQYDRDIKATGLYDGHRRKVPSPDGRETPEEDYSWTEHTSRRLASQNPRVLRLHMREFLLKKGFKLG
jgi:nitroreductase